MEQKIISYEEIMQANRLYRINLINSLTGYKSANLIGTQDKSGATNVAVFSSVTHLGSHPPIVGVVMRPTTVPRNTYENIRETGFYTINHIHQSWVEDAHHTSAKYPKEVSEFDQTNLTPSHEHGFFAPYVKEAVIKLGMEFKEEIPIKVNGTILLLGEIKQVILPKSILAEDGFVDLNAAQTVTISGLDAYHLPEYLGRFAYARPNQAVEQL